MSNELTWADVAHYYGKSKPRPFVFLPKEGGYVSAERYFYDHADAADLPILCELSDITEEDAREFLELNNIRPPYEPWDMGRDISAKDFFIEADVLSNFENVCYSPKSIHFLISRNYNVFGVETYKPGT